MALCAHSDRPVSAAAFTFISPECTGRTLSPAQAAFANEGSLIAFWSYHSTDEHWLELNLAPCSGMGQLLNGTAVNHQHAAWTACGSQPTALEMPGSATAAPGSCHGTWQPGPSPLEPRTQQYRALHKARRLPMRHARPHTQAVHAQSLAWVVKPSPGACFTHTLDCQKAQPIVGQGRCRFIGDL